MLQDEQGLDGNRFVKISNFCVTICTTTESGPEQEGFPFLRLFLVRDPARAREPAAPGQPRPSSGRRPRAATAAGHAGTWPRPAGPGGRLVVRAARACLPPSHWPAAQSVGRGGGESAAALPRERARRAWRRGGSREPGTSRAVSGAASSRRCRGSGGSVGGGRSCCAPGSISRLPVPQLQLPSDAPAAARRESWKQLVRLPRLVLNMLGEKKPVMVTRDLYADPTFPASDTSLFFDYCTPLAQFRGQISWLRPKMSFTTVMKR
ncbi:uncharacterized protein LOC135991738 [Caloenas nicobarica]|uniref:uncharacterized protein LOC135991738 n=1 Tax=Caloenas nicobarica TaxID=187106 RepID=UPI0032B77B22